MSALLRFIAIYVGVSAVLAVIALASVWPHRPGSWVGWMVLFVLALPLTLALEYTGDWLFRNRIAQEAERRGPIPLILYVFVAVAVVGVGAAVALHWLGL